jgi:hypothetical protein
MRFDWYSKMRFLSLITVIAILYMWAVFSIVKRALHSQEPVYFYCCITFFLLGALTIMILATLGIITF